MNDTKFVYTDTVVPAAPGWLLIRPMKSGEQMTTYTVDIIAWHIQLLGEEDKKGDRYGETSHDVIPIAFDKLFGDEPYVVRHETDTCFTDYSGTQYPNIESVLDMFKKHERKQDELRKTYASNKGKKK